MIGPCRKDDPVKLLRILLGVIVGYAVMVVGITLVQETWFGGVGWYESPLGELAVAGFFTTVAAGVGAAAGTAVAGLPGRTVATVMSLLVITETTALTVQGRLTGPMWFDVIAALGLIVGIFLGAILALRLRRGPAVATA